MTSPAPATVPLTTSADQVEALQLAKQATGREIDLQDHRPLWDEEIATIPADVRDQLPTTTWHWAIYPWRNLAILVPDRDTFRAVVTSRNYPIINRVEQRTLFDSTVLLAGLSTGRAVAQQLARLGVGGFVLGDADAIAPSNLNRLMGAGLADLALPKVTSTARELLELNPYTRIAEVPLFLDQQVTTDLIATHNVNAVIEMIDNIDAKAGIRRAARAAGLGVVMATDMDWDPFVDIELPHRELFNGRLTDADLAKLADPATDFVEKTQMAMRFMALDKWADRSALGGELARAGLLRFWSQTAPSAATAGALAARAAFDLLRGQTDLPVRVTVSLRDGFGTTDEVDPNEPLVAKLAESKNSP